MILKRYKSYPSQQYRAIKMKNRTITFIIGIFVFISTSLYSQVSENVIENIEKQQVIDSVITHLNDRYIFPDVADQIAKKLKNNIKNGLYNKINSYGKFGSEITTTLKSINNDRHLWIWYNPDWINEEKLRIQNLSTGNNIGLEEAKINNFGFKEVKILDNNIGYLRLDEFTEYPEALEIVEGVFQSISDCDALIIDLRNNSGGSPEMVQLLCSYLLPNPSIHLNSLVYKNNSKVDQYWTYYFLPGERFINKPVYVLVGERTASAAEEFAYNLQNLKRVKIIGEQTRGAAHDNEFLILNSHYFMSLPIARAVNPITNTNWENTGITPDIVIEEEQALKETLELILKD